jgi:hypothetical protein
MESLQNCIIGIAGMKGYGKSTYLKNNFENSHALALIDTLGEHSAWCPPCPEKDIEKQVEWLASPPDKFMASFMLNPELKDENRDELHFNMLLKAAYMAGDMTLVIEEVDNHASANYLPPGLKIVVDYGRHRSLDIVWLTRNLPDVPRKLTSQTDIFVLFRQQEPLYLEKLGDRFPREVVDEVAKLPKFSYIIINPEVKEWSVRSL